MTLSRQRIGALWIKSDPCALGSPIETSRCRVDGRNIYNGTFERVEDNVYVMSPVNRMVVLNGTPTMANQTWTMDNTGDYVKS